MDTRESPERRYIIRCIVCRTPIGYDDNDEDEQDVCDDCETGRYGLRF